jgi:Zn-finger nucleic acid-binding protein
VSYRDSFERCPRCRVELVDARSARSCPRCRGLWVDEVTLTEMILAMLPPRPLSRLALAVLQRADLPLPCPTCGEVMAPTTIHELLLDRCAKHGIWFDRQELQLALHRVATREDPPLEELPQRRTMPSPPPAAPAPPPTAGARAPGPGEGVAFEIRSTGQPPRVVTVKTDIIKIGRLASAHVHLDDPTASRLHAVVEVSDTIVRLIDLGSNQGTLVNGQRVNHAPLASGDTIEVGASVLRVTFSDPPL